MNLDAMVPNYVRCFQNYVPSRPDHLLLQEYGAPLLHRLNNNENPLGPPQPLHAPSPHFLRSWQPSIRAETPTTCVRPSAAASIYPPTGSL